MDFRGPDQMAYFLKLAITRSEVGKLVESVDILT